jgi:PAS domain S-box-containing protein
MADDRSPSRIDVAALLTAIVESTDDAIISTDLNRLITFWNPSAERVYGYSVNEALGAPNTLIIPSDRRVEEEATLGRLLAGESVSTYDTVRLHKDGRRIDVSMTASAVRDPRGQIIGISKITRDLSTRLRRQRHVTELIGRMSDAFCAVDEEWRVTYVNSRYLELAGVRREDLLGRNIWTVLPDATRTKVYEAAQRVISDGTSITVEDYDPTRDLWFETRLYPADGGVASFMTDITDRKRMDRMKDETLLASRRLAAIVESSEDAIVAKDLNGMITSWNRAAERMFGYTDSEAIGQSIRIIVPDDRQDEETAILERVTRGEPIDHFETIRCRKDGSCLPIALTVSPIRDDSGSVIGASKIARDVTERKRLEENAAVQHRRTMFLERMTATLSKSLNYEHTLQEVAELTVPGIADWCAVDILQEDGEIARVGVAHTDRAKIELAVELRRRYEDPTAPYSVPEVIKTGTAALISDITDDMIVAAASGDRERIDLVRSLGLKSYLCVPLVSGGQTLGALTLATGLSRRRYTEDDLRFAEDIASRAALAMQNARAYEQLQQANRLKDEFLATLSHELRTPLNAILGYARIVRGGMLSTDKMPPALATIERNAIALTQMVEDILDVSRIVAGKMRLNVQPVEVPLVLQEAVETIRPAADAKRIKLHTVIDPQVSPIAGDPDRLRQVVWNLLSNAVKFTPKEGQIQLRLERINSSVEITISDNGIGIQQEVLPHIFERFRQGDAGSTRAHAGLGLGLAIVRNLVELHGGTVYASSAGPDTGATFRVRLPVMIVHPEVREEKRVHPKRSSPARLDRLPDLSGVHVFVVDDEPDALRLLVEILESSGARVTMASSGAAALEKIITALPDVLVADLGMPLMDGFELIRRIREIDNRRIRDIPAAALTAYARSEDRVRTLEAGFEMHLPKPVDPLELASAIKALARRVSREE